MEMTAQQADDVKERFRSRSQRAIASILVFWATLILYVAGANEDAGTWFGLPSLVWAPLIALGTLGGLIGFATSMRCPSCSKSYGRPFITKFCGSCGVPLK